MPQKDPIDAPFPGFERVLAESASDDGSSRRRFLAILLCYNDADMLQPAIDHLVGNRHDVICWNHGSEDETDEICRSYLGRGVIEYQRLDRERVPFRDLYAICSQYLIDAYVGRFDWLSWPDQDELLQGPDLRRPYWEQVEELLDDGFDFVVFDNYVFWYTAADDPRIIDPTKRIRHYSRYECPPRVRAWRLSLTNQRSIGNHNGISGRRVEPNWPLLHYPMRSRAQALRRIHHDRNQPGFQFGENNWHYMKFREDVNRLEVPAESLHRFDGTTLDPEITWEFYERPSHDDLTREAGPSDTT